MRKLNELVSVHSLLQSAYTWKSSSHSCFLVFSLLYYVVSVSEVNPRVEVSIKSQHKAS